MNLNERNICEFKTIISTQTEFSKLFEMAYGEVYDEELYLLLSKNRQGVSGKSE